MKVNVADENMKFALLIAVQNVFILAVYGQRRITPWTNRDCARVRMTFSPLEVNLSAMHPHPFSFLFESPAEEFSLSVRAIVRQFFA